jgi:hypothetical protein
MEPTLDYASRPQQRNAFRRGMASVSAVTIATIGAAAGVCLSAQGALEYLGSFGGCATGREEALFELRVLVPIACSLAGAGWWLANRVGEGVLICRCAFWAGVAAWVTACICAFK